MADEVLVVAATNFSNITFDDEDVDTKKVFRVWLFFFKKFCLSFKQDIHNDFLFNMESTFKEVKKEIIPS